MMLPLRLRMDTFVRYFVALSGSHLQRLGVGQNSEFAMYIVEKSLAQICREGEGQRSSQLNGTARNSVSKIGLSLTSRTFLFEPIR